MTADISIAIKETTELFKTRGAAEDWSHNIITGSRSLKTDQEYTNYYAWLASPQTFDKNRNYKAQTKVEKRPAVPDGYEEIIHKNGTESVVLVRKIRVDDEKEEKSQ